MPLPEHPLVLYGGCNCRAVRYTITIPAASECPLNPLSDGKVSFPMVATDHCNDCRRATGAILPTWICVPKPMMEGHLEPRSENRMQDMASNGAKDWLPATSVFHEGPLSDEYWLKFYKSLEWVTRSFCGRCGTNLTYAISPSMGNGWPDLFDVILGTLDKECLEQDWMAPDRHCWVDCEIGWIKALTSGGTELPRHPTYKLNELAPQ